MEFTTFTAVSVTKKLTKGGLSTIFSDKLYPKVKSQLEPGGKNFTDLGSSCLDHNLPIVTMIFNDPLIST